MNPESRGFKILSKILGKQNIANDLQNKTTKLEGSMLSNISLNPIPLADSSEQCKIINAENYELSLAIDNLQKECTKTRELFDCEEFGKNVTCISENNLDALFPLEESKEKMVNEILNLDEYCLEEKTFATDANKEQDNLFNEDNSYFACGVPSTSTTFQYS